eukprot:4966556-Amphidinium_carterae.1
MFAVARSSSRPQVVFLNNLHCKLDGSNGNPGALLPSEQDSLQTWVLSHWVAEYHPTVFDYRPVENIFELIH